MKKYVYVLFLSLFSLNICTSDDTDSSLVTATSDRDPSTLPFKQKLKIFGRKFKKKKREWKQ